MDMQNHEINITNISPSFNNDRSCYFLFDSEFEINKKNSRSKKIFKYTGYYDPITNRVIVKTINKTKKYFGNSNKDLLIEMAMKLLLTDQSAYDLFLSVIRKINIKLQGDAHLIKAFPSFSDIIALALNSGFQLIKITPSFHFIKTIRTQKGDIENHICTPSITEVVDELNDYLEFGTTGEYYTYRQLVLLCVGHSDFFISPSPEGNGWLFFWYGDDAFEIHSRRVDTLKELYDEIMFRINHPVIP